MDIAAPAADSAPAAPAAPPANDNAAPPANPASEAGKTLAQRRADIQARLREPKAEPKPEPTNAEPPKQEAKPEQRDDELAALIREDRRIKTQARELEAKAAEIKAVEPWLPRIRAAEAALAKGDKLAALRSIFPDSKLTDDLFWDLAKAVGSESEGGEAAPDVAALVREQLAAEIKAREDAEAAAQKQRADHADRELHEARTEYITTCSQVFDAHKDKFPAIAALGITAERVRRFVEEEHVAQHGRVPTALEALEALERETAERIRSTPYGRPAEVPRSAPTVTNSWRSDPGRPAPSDDVPRSLEEIREARRAKLRSA